MTRRLEQAGFAGMDQDALEWRQRGHPELSVETLPGVGPKVAERLAALGIETLEDLVEYVPRAHLDWAQAMGFGELRTGQEATVACTVERQAQVRPTRRRNLRLVEAAVVDSQGGRATALWFNQSWLAEQLVPGTRLLLRGELSAGGRFKVQRHELGEGGLHTVGLVPVYRASETVSAAKLRELTELALPLARWLPDALPAKVRAEEGLPLRGDALLAYHRPTDREEVTAAHERLALEELLVLLYGLARRRRETDDAATAPVLGEPGELVTRYVQALPFELTPEQRSAIAELDRDLARATPMQRLLQGDVGTGKTVVALYALLRAVENGHQGALMVPTETLAEQHFVTIDRLVAPLGVAPVLLTSSLAPKQHAATRDAVANGQAQLVVGTHALIQEHVEFSSLAVAVVDEQHRFGVEQRRALSGSAERSPHILHMTATPIPRTLAQTVYGDLDVTEIARPPRDRKEIITAWVPQERSAAAYTRLRKHLEDGRQAYVVCPLVSESETIEARAAEAEAERLSRAELKGFRVGCLHGRLAAPERRAVMDAFTRRELDVLVATTVIEVGVDVPNATIMIVQEADRFGLAQLHQLRGRVGRGAEQSYCLLVSRAKEELTESAQTRLQALVDSTDGFRLAEVDLDLRGEGELLGTRQSGLPDLRFASLGRDSELIARAKRRVAELLEDDPDTLGPLEAEVERMLGDADRRGLA